MKFIWNVNYTAIFSNWVPPGGLHAHRVPLMHRHYDDYRITLAVFDRPELERHGLEPFRRYSCHGFHRDDVAIMSNSTRKTVQ